MKFGMTAHFSKNQYALFFQFWFSGHMLVSQVYQLENAIQATISNVIIFFDQKCGLNQQRNRARC